MAAGALQIHLPLAEFIVARPFTAPPGPGRESGIIFLLSFLVTFAFIRTSARMIRAQVSWWPGNVETSSGLHLHHLVWGISALIVFSFLAVSLEPQSPWWQICVVGMGIGAGLTLDEFALWVHLRDVYWSGTGRSSIDAVLMTAVFMGLVVLGTSPFGLDGGETSWVAVAYAAQALVLSFLAFMKGRLFFGLLALFIPVFGLFAALRLARPTSPWARRFYVGRRPEKLERAEKRFGPDALGTRTRDGFFNLIGGRPDSPETAAKPEIADPGAPVK